MAKWILSAIMLAQSVVLLSAETDYVKERKAAIDLVRAGKHEEALTKFTQMLALAASDVQRADALRQASTCAQSLQQHDRAMELAQKIPLIPVSKTCQMLVLEGQRRWQDILDRFKDADIDSWPESVRGEAFYARGHAAFAVKDGTAAAKDLSRAVEYLADGNSKALCFICLGDTYATLLQDDAKAIEAYRRTYGTGNVYKHCQAAINVAHIFDRQQKFGPALDELSCIPMTEVTAPYWRGRMFGTMGQTLVRAGRKADAVSRYRQALAIEGLPAVIRMDCEQALKHLEREPK